MNRLFIEKVLILCLTSFLMYYFSRKLMAEFMFDEEVNVNVPSHLKLNKYEKSIYQYVVKSPTDTFESIKGLEKQARILKNVLNTKLDKPSGFILYGSPGTGKTMLARAVANYYNRPIILLSSDIIENKLFGESGKLLKATFTLANKLEKCIIFIDELDGMCSVRNPLDQSFVTSLKTTMMTCLDGFQERNQDIFVIAATNMLDMIDPAIKRRLAIHISIPLPDTATKLEYLKEDFPDITEKYVEEYFEYSSLSDLKEARNLSKIMGSKLPSMELDFSEAESAVES